MTLMIFVLNNDDPQVVEDGYYKHCPRQIFGLPYAYIKGATNYPRLERDENLFIVAQGNDHEIGNKGDAISLDAEASAAWLKDHLLPHDYRGSIFVSACNSAPIFIVAL